VRCEGGELGSGKRGGEEKGGVWDGCKISPGGGLERKISEAAILTKQPKVGPRINTSDRIRVLSEEYRGVVLLKRRKGLKGEGVPHGSISSKGISQTRNTILRDAVGEEGNQTDWEGAWQGGEGARSREKKDQRPERSIQR